jgi:hypothetical protein
MKLIKIVFIILVIITIAEIGYYLFYKFSTNSSKVTKIGQNTPSEFNPIVKILPTDILYPNSPDPKFLDPIKKIRFSQNRIMYLTEILKGKIQKLDININKIGTPQDSLDVNLTFDLVDDKNNLLEHISTWHGSENRILFKLNAKNDKIPIDRSELQNGDKVTIETKRIVPTYDNKLTNFSNNVFEIIVTGK